MSDDRIYNNIKVLCKHHGIKIKDIEFPASVGFISRYAVKGKTQELPIWVFVKLSEASGVPIDDIVKKDIASEIELTEIREQIERLKKRAEDIEWRKEAEDAIH